MPVTIAIERLNEEFLGRINMSCVLPSTDRVCVRFWELLATEQITSRKVDGWQSLQEPQTSIALDRAA